MSEDSTPDYEGVEEPPAVPEVPEGSVEIRLEDLSILPLEPGDIILVRLPGRVYEHDIVRAREYVMKHLPGHEVLVIAEDVELAVVRPPQTVAVDQPVGFTPKSLDLLDPGAFPGDVLADLRALSELPRLPTVDRMSINPEDAEHFGTLFPSEEASFWGQPIPADTPVAADDNVPKGHVRVQAGGRDYVIQLPPRPEWRHDV